MKADQYITGLISVVIPTCNRSALLKRAIQSVLNQTYQNFEIIIVNDGSKDATKDYLDYLITTDSRIRIFHNYPNKGASAARNVGVYNARGEYFTLLDDDDEFLPTRLEVLLDKFQDQWSFVCSGFFVQSKDGIIRRNNSRKVISEGNIFWRNIMGNSLLTYTKYIKEIGGCDETLTSKIDYDLFVRLILRFGNALRIENLLLIQHKEHDQIRIGTHPNWYRGQLKFYKKYMNRMSDDQRFFYRYIYYKNTTGVGDYKLLLKSFKTLPIQYKYLEVGHLLNRKFIRLFSSIFSFDKAKANK
ncbi:MAG: glycosyltransferase [Bacteroidota bacterium]